MSDRQKALIFLADGMADNPLPELNGATPLEAANTPAMDSIANRGVNGLFKTLPAGLPTSSDVANMSVLGFQPELNYPGRGPIEAASQGIILEDDDVAWRCNLVYSENGILRDYSAGHITTMEAAALMKKLKKRFDSDKLTFHSGVSYRNLLVLHGKEFSAKVNYHKPDSSQDMPLEDLQLTPADSSEAARHTVDFLKKLDKESSDFLSELGGSANQIWPWSPGYRPQLAEFSTRYAGRKGAVISAVDVIKGLGKCTGMDVIEVPGATGFLDTNYAGKVEAALEAIQKYDLVYLHVEAIDECSHLGDLKLKTQAIEDFDAKIVAPVLDKLVGQPINFAVLPDHPVPIKLRQHTTDPVPLAICGPAFKPDNITRYSERLAPEGSLGILEKEALIRLLLNL